jgi:Plasmid pRiA4b ORF-3-like protein
VCTGGKRACPPEDCGGIWGYEEMLETLNSVGEEKVELIEWLGEDFDPEVFEIDRVNWRLKKLK